jgi:hypothetical protein
MKSDWCVCLDLTTVEFCWLILVMFSVKFNGSSAIGIWVVPCKRADLTKRIVASRIFANAPKTFSFYTLEVASMAQVAGFTTPKSCFSRRTRKIAKTDYELRHVYPCVLSARPHGTTRLPLNVFWWKLAFEIFPPRKSVEKIQVWLKSDKDNG